jgi:DNA recombination protein RmuC
MGHAFSASARRFANRATLRIMKMDDIVLQVGTSAFSLLDILLAAAGAALVMLLVTLIFAWRLLRSRRTETLEVMRRSSELEYRLAELSGSLKSFADQSHGSQTQLALMLDERLDQVSHRVGTGLTDQAERTAQSLDTLNQRLAVIDAAQKNLTSLSTEMISLKEILANKQTRGAYGQGRMEAIIRDGLHSKAYAFQSTLSNGMRPDCIISLPESVIKLVIDAKFPLEAFNALKEARGEPEVKAAEARLRTDVSRHIKDIAEKYLISGETHETAILFVPSESIYADLHEHYEDMVQKAHRSHVIIASPNVLMLLVQTMQAIFRDSAMREQAHVIKIEVTRLLEDVGRLKDRVGDLQKHFGLANVDLEKLTISAGKVTSRALRIESLDLEEQAPAVAAVSAPKLVSRS